MPYFTEICQLFRVKSRDIAFRPHSPERQWKRASLIMNYGYPGIWSPVTLLLWEVSPGVGGELPRIQVYPWLFRSASQVKESLSRQETTILAPLWLAFTPSIEEWNRGAGHLIRVDVSGFAFPCSYLPKGTAVTRKRAEKTPLGAGQGI